MLHISPLPPDKASKEVNEVYEEFYRQMSFPSPPNFITTQGHSSTVVRGTWEAVQNILVKGLIPRWHKELMFVAISRDRGCRYCTAAHLACCRMLGVKPGVLEHMVTDVNKIPDPKLRDTTNFAVKCSRAPRALTEQDYESLRHHGLTQAEMVEIIAMSALAVYANIIADATAMEADLMFDNL
jgi:uncharacterized peroxidase-related enzyme